MVQRIRLTTKAGASFTTMTSLPIFFPHSLAIANVSIGCFIAFDDFQQAHDRHGVEKMGPDKLVGPLGHCRHLRDAEPRGVGEKQAMRPVRSDSSSA